MMIVTLARKKIEEYRNSYQFSRGNALGVRAREEREKKIWL